LEAHRSAVSVHRIAQIFRERNLDISIPHLVRLPWFPLQRIRLTNRIWSATSDFCPTGWMSEGEEVKRRRRRSSQEIQRLVVEFRTSGLRQSASDDTLVLKGLSRKASSFD
jgi:hypothetical protein